MFGPCGGPCGIGIGGVQGCWLRMSGIGAGTGVGGGCIIGISLAMLPCGP
jgi:hypothetical protein